MSDFRRLAVMFVLLGALCYSNTASAKIIFFSVADEKIIKVKDLPKTPHFYDTRQKKNFNLGWIWKQVTIFWVPIWNYGGRYCGHVGKDDFYLIIPEAKLRQVMKEQNVEFPKNKPKLSFWNRIGGKLALGGVLLGFILIGVMRRKES